MEGLCVWDAATLTGPGCKTAPDQPYAAFAWDIDFSPDGERLAMANFVAADGYGHLWNARTGESLGSWVFNAVEFSPDSDRLVSISEFGRTIEVRDAEDAAVLATRPLEGIDVALASPRYLLGGSVVVAAPFGSAGGDLVFFDADTLDETERIANPHESGVRHIATNPDGTRFATAGGDGFVKVWDAATHELIDTIRVARDDRVQAVGFANDGRHLIAATASGTVVMYTLDPGELLDIARSRLLRGFTDLECSLYFADGDCPTLAELRGS